MALGKLMNFTKNTKIKFVKNLKINSLMVR